MKWLGGKMNKEFSEDYHDYVFKDGKLVGKFEEMYQHASMPWHQDELAYMIFSEIDLTILRQRRYERILDIGCGLGYFTNRLKQELKNSCGGQPDVTAIDISSTAVAKARELFPGIDFQVADIHHQNPFQAESFDLIVCKDLMWYVFDHLLQLISIMKHILRKGGFLYISQSFPGGENYVGKEVIKSPLNLKDIFSRSLKPVYYMVEWDPEDKDRPLAHILLKKQ
jgi:SAM-dependent methyltransferase